MRVLKVFFLGLAFGWFMRWIMAEIFLRDAFKRLSNENALLKQRIQSLETPRSLGVRSREGMAAAALPVEEVKPATRRKAVRGEKLVDNLKMVKGIGPQIERKLNKAGVYTFAELSRLSPEHLKSILGTSKVVTQNADSMLTQAKKFASQGPKG